MIPPRDDVWHGPGLNWVRTPFGWRKITGTDDQPAPQTEGLVSQHSSLNKSKYTPRDLIGSPQPSIIVTGSFTREVVLAQIAMSQVLTRMDLEGAIKDCRRFHFVCKLIQLILETKFQLLSGVAQKRVMALLDCILDQVLHTETHLSVANNLAKIAETTLIMHQFQHMGGKRLWEQHFDVVNRMLSILDNFQVTEREEDGGLMMSHLPDDVITEIFLRFEDHADIENYACTDERMFKLSQKDEIWRSLTIDQYSQHLNGRFIKLAQNIGWKKVYQDLARKHPKREEYSERLCLCSYCHALFWQLHGHPCLESRETTDVITYETPLNPTECVKMFMA